MPPNFSAAFSEIQVTVKQNGGTNLSISFPSRKINRFVTFYSYFSFFGENRLPQLHFCGRGIRPAGSRSLKTEADRWFASVFKLYCCDTAAERRNGIPGCQTGLLFSPQTQSWSKTAIRDFPRSLRLYSTFGGICGYSVLMIRLSRSSSFRFVLRVLSDMFLHISSAR